MAEHDPKLVEAIAFFEQMLQTMPLDRTSLEFLSVAYEQTGQDEKRRDCLVRLADCLLNERDFDNAQVIAARLSVYLNDPAVRAVVERVAEMIQGQALASPSAPLPAAPWAAHFEQAQGAPPAPYQDAGLEVHALSRAAATAEMDLVWYWKEHNFLPKEICMDVLHVLTDRPVTDTPMLISAFALLDEEHPELTDQLMEAMQRASDIPPIPLELFELNPAAMQVLAPSFVHVKGALPFALIGDDALVALLNPLNAALREEISARAGRVCHFFLAHPRVWQQVAQNVV
jgi:hypothetical protein